MVQVLALVGRPSLRVPGREPGPRRAPVQQGLGGLRGLLGFWRPAPRGRGPDEFGEQVRGARGALVGELPFRDDGPALGAGIEGASPEAPGRVERRDVRVIIGETLQVAGRVEQGHHAARDVQRGGARDVKPPPGPGAQELCHESRLSHEE
jgi:hypothetical protein